MTESLQSFIVSKKRRTFWITQFRNNCYRLHKQKGEGGESERIEWKQLIGDLSPRRGIKIAGIQPSQKYNIVIRNLVTLFLRSLFVGEWKRKIERA